MGSSCSPLTANFFTEWLEDLTICTALVKPSFKSRYVDDTLFIMKKDSIDEFKQHINSVHPMIQ